MNLTGIKTSATRLLGRAKLYGKKYGPTALVVGGIGGITVGTVKAVKVAPKANDIWVKNKELVTELRNSNPDELEERELNKQITGAYVHTLWEVTKVFGPAILWWITGAGCVLGGHYMLVKANAELALAYKELETAYKEKESRFEGCKTVQDENGEKVEATKSEVAELKLGYSEYARLFGEDNPNWQKYPGANQSFISSQREFLQAKLEAQGHLFLNEVYDALGFPRTANGNIVGWYIDYKHPSENYIDFFGQKTEGHSRFLEGYERSVWLDFNVDGNILDLI